MASSASNSNEDQNFSNNNPTTHENIDLMRKIQERNNNSPKMRHSQPSTRITARLNQSGNNNNNHNDDQTHAHESPHRSSMSSYEDDFHDYEVFFLLFFFFSLDCYYTHKFYTYLHTHTNTHTLLKKTHTRAARVATVGMSTTWI